MWWIIAGAAGVVLVGVGAVWFLAPTMLTFRHPGFDPAPKDDASVDKANQSWTIGGGAGGAGGV
jgi:hypothetical protein